MFGCVMYVSDMTLQYFRDLSANNFTGPVVMLNVQPGAHWYVLLFFFLEY
jgi:hypothetical protein